MRWMRTAALCAAILAFSSLAFAEATGTWEYRFWNPNQDNRFITGAVGSDKVLLAYGQEKDAQGNSTPVFKRSANGGESWGDVTIPVENAFFNIFTDMVLLNKDDGFAVGASMNMMGQPLAGPMWRIKKGGLEVESLFVEGGPMCFRMDCLDLSHCWATCEKGKIIRTDDGGETWKSAALPAEVTEEMNPGPICFISVTEGWATYYYQEYQEPEQEGEEGTSILHDKGTILHTTDGGATWQALVSGEHLTYSTIQFTSSQIGYLGASDETNGFLMKTTNGGKDWFIQPLPPKFPSQYGDLPLYYIGDVHFFDDDKGWIVASYGSEGSLPANTLKFFYTENGAMRFDEHEATNPDGQVMPGTMHRMVFLNEHLGFAFGEFELVLQYSDGQYEPPVDGDADGDADGGADGDEDVDTGPVYTGGPGEPCPVPGVSETYDYPRCDAGQGSAVCAWKEGEATTAVCTTYCTQPQDCRVISIDACCKPVAYDGGEKRLCLIDPIDCVEYHGQTWHGYAGSLVGEDCNPQAQPVECDPNWGGDGCLAVSDPYCSKACLTDADCAGGFQTDYCCSVDAGETKYCAYGAACHAATDGDVPADGDSAADGDAPPDGDLPADGDGTTNPEQPDGSGSGCGATAGGPLAWLLLAALAARRKR
ncbi:MAG: hypothetical protein C4523_14665 [Myxococcales bacterium]|nr:MAG: hypothetical protein C4523_14665 [Myxococcales bacterium]